MHGKKCPVCDNFIEETEASCSKCGWILKTGPVVEPRSHEVYRKYRDDLKQAREKWRLKKAHEEKNEIISDLNEKINLHISAKNWCAAKECIEEWLAIEPGSDSANEYLRIIRREESRHSESEFYRHQPSYSDFQPYRKERPEWAKWSLGIGIAGIAFSPIMLIIDMILAGAPIFPEVTCFIYGPIITILFAIGLFAKKE